MPKRFEFQPQLSLDSKPRDESRVEYERQPRAPREPTIQRGAPTDDAPWWRRAREASSAPTSTPPPTLSFANAWRGLLREEAWTVELPSSELVRLESLVRQLDVRPGVVEASIGGGREKPHRVQLKLAPFPTTDWASLARRLAERTTEAALADDLANGRVPLVLLEACDARSLSFVPRRLALVAGTCTCGGAKLPCDHVLATHLVLARKMGAAPWTLLTWRGAPPSDLAALVSRVRSELARATSTTGSEGPLDPFAAPAPLEVDWSKLEGPAPARASLPPIEGWRPSESFDALCRRLLAPVGKRSDTPGVFST